MMKRLQGRSLAHVGCLTGVTAGLTVGIILGGVLAAVFNVSLNMVLLAWLGLTIGLGIMGWVIGERLSTPFPSFKELARRSDADEVTPPEPPASEPVKEA